MEKHIIKKRFGKGNWNWNKDVVYNRAFLSTQQRYIDDLLASRGHVLLLDVYDILGIARTAESCSLGRVKGVGDEKTDLLWFYWKELPDHPNEFELTFICYPILDYLEKENVAG